MEPSASKMTPDDSYDHYTKSTFLQTIHYEHTVAEFLYGRILCFPKLLPMLSINLVLDQLKTTVAEFSCFRCHHF